MPGDKGASFPIAAIGVVMLLVSSAFVGQRAFDLLRLAETATNRQQQLQPPVEARLWEDPLAALARHRDKYKDRCDALAVKRAAPAAQQTVAALRAAVATNKDVPPLVNEGEDRVRYDPICDGAPPDFSSPVSDPEFTVIVALLPGASFVGAEESRRRMRYAVLAGLAVEGFVPIDGERMGFFSPSLCDKFIACLQSQPLVDIPFEILRDGHDRRAVVLWVNDVPIGRNWLSTAAVLLSTVAPPAGAKLRLLGPFNSDKLIDALGDNLSQLAEEALEVRPKARDEQRATFRALWQILNRITLVSPSSTTAALRLRDEAQAAVNRRAERLGVESASLPTCRPVESSTEPVSAQGQCLEEVFRKRLKEIGQRLGDSTNERPEFPPFFVRTIGSDDNLATLLVKELCARGLGVGAWGEGSADHRIVLLHEWDSIYARAFAESLEAKLQCPGWGDGGGPKNIKVYSYLRGIDGANLDGAPKQLRLVTRAGIDKDDKDKKDKEPSLEWPETRDQRDYVRRLVANIRKEADRDRVKVAAVGIFGLDVHDKLIVTQVLREAFPDRLVFTTDLDARLMHPEVLPYTQNLLVASNLPLVPPSLSGDPGPESLRQGSTTPEEQLGMPPFRDSYQTAAFLAARYAVSGSMTRLAALQELLSGGYVFEIGRHGEVELGKLDQESRVREGYFLISGGVWAILAWLILWGQPGPAMQAAFAKGPNVSWRGFHLSTAVLCAFTVGALGFALGVILELRWPGVVGWRGALRLAAVAVVLFMALVYPGAGRCPAAPFDPDWYGKADAVQDRARWKATLYWILRVVMRWFVLLGVLAYLATWPAHDASDPGMHEPFAPMSGISAWPSQLLRTLVLVLLPWFLDRAWNRCLGAGDFTGERFFPSCSPTHRHFRPPINAARWRWRWKQLGKMLKPEFKLIWRSLVTYGQTRRRRLERVFLAITLWFWNPQLVWTHNRRIGNVDSRVDGRRLWLAHFLLLRNWPRLWRLLSWVVFTVTIVAAIAWMLGYDWPETPVRGLDDRFLVSLTKWVAVGGTLVLLIVVTNAAVLTCRLIYIMKQGRTIYPRETVERFAAELGPRVPAGAPSYHPNSLFDPWIDVKFMAAHTARINPLIVLPCVLLGLLIIARSRVFDNWGSGLVLVVLGCYLLWAVAMAAVLNVGAEMARRKALEEMERDLRWLKGSGPAYKELSDQFPSLIAQVREMREGAFAPFFEQPLVRAIMVPLGSAGGMQLLEAFLVARGG